MKDSQGSMETHVHTRDTPYLPERRKRVRRVNKERRDQVRWETKSAIRRTGGPGRRALDRMMVLEDHVRM